MALRYVSDFFKTAVSSISPYKVEEYTPDQHKKQFAKCIVIKNSPNFMLYKVANYFDMVYICEGGLKPKVFSLFRIQSEEESIQRFQNMSEVITSLDQCCSVTRDKASLEKVVNCLKNNPDWNAGHVAANLALSDCFNTYKLADLMNVADSVKGQTPLHVAIISNNKDIARLLLSFPGIDVDMRDKDGNTIFHMAVNINDAGLLKVFVELANQSLDILNEEGKSAVYVACETQAIDCLKTLLEAGADTVLSAADDSAFHVAVRLGSIECVNLLAEKSSDNLTLFTQISRHSALHLAASKEMTVSLCKLGCGINLQDSEGNTPLHTHILNRQSEVVLWLLILNADPNIPNNNFDYPLHSAVDLDDLDNIRALIVFEADVNVVNKAGVSPRHRLASRKNKRGFIFRQAGSNYPDMLYTLHSVGARRCPPDFLDCSNGCSCDGDDDGTNPSPMHNPLERDTLDDLVSSTTLSFAATRPTTSKHSSNHPSSSSPVHLYRNNANPGRKTPSAPPSTSPLGLTYSSSSDLLLEEEMSLGNHSGYRILSLDGGGIRGLVLTQMLRGIEVAAGRPIVEIFDWIAGTSTGGLLALNLVHGKSVKECRSMYFEMKDTVFQGKRPYPAEPFEELLKKELGENTLMTDVTHPKVAVTALLCDRFPPRLHIFRNYDPPLTSLHSGHRDSSCRPSKNQSSGPVFEPVSPPEEQIMWKAARATGAAPTFFRACGRFLDGGLMANNPTLDILTEIEEYNLSQHIQDKTAKLTQPGIVVSLGTGRIPVEEVTRIDVFRPNNPLEVVMSAMGVSSLGRILIEMATLSEGRVVDRARAWCHSLRVPFFRFSPPISADLPLDVTDNSTLLQMLWETAVYTHHYKHRFQQMANIL